jgi:outer membrane lipoprotein-sorting protein
VTHLWSKGDRFRAETVIAGRRIVTIVNGSTYYTIDPVRGFGLGIERSELALGEDARRGRPFGVEYEMILLGGGELVKKDELGGQEVELYRLTNNAGRVEVWVTPTAKLPIRVERFVRSTGRREQVSYVDWRSGVDIADSFFEPSPNLKIDRMGYEEYVKRTMAERLGPAPPLHSQLLHGEHRRR